VWTIITPWVVSGNFDTHNTIVNNAIVGGVICLLALVTIGIGPMAKRMARRQDAGGGAAR
jgi:hypothetical protein